MKYLYFVAFAAVFPTALLAQEVPDQSGVAIVKKAWKMKHVPPQNPVLLQDPFDAIEQSNIASRNARAPDAQIGAGSTNGVPPGFRREPLLPAVYSDRGGRTIYTYEVYIRNDNVLSIKAIMWDYVFFDPVTKLEVGRHRFLNTVDLKPGRSRTVGMKLASPPTSTVDVRSVGKRTQELFLEQIIIRGVEFSDGTAWLPLAESTEVARKKP